ncbi:MULTISPECIES: TetR/AcrR family transcriptional regulator [Lysinibacillus]|jgi:AcrR family transcriptional regulator|uniref:TetR/AcrR family transcriptional regulator n=1 Tax=Lysinibacillus fusiformis TaxID=28031 RepID=A0A2I0UY59_9BACI|nr:MULTISPECIES: TetR/AcrR family transcriptional regulator [Lysinibacillus]KUF35642.1 TetR family transcriptional regulator [Lysinibacillus sp. F5]PKU50929.1 TetR/AcrR family transcriptional regulator [Lysinibacillus fusiformis]WCH49504.1 TetR/AcrR family transcriptional regulator [Lysinibacillus sp. OF-1]SCY15114.1 transcriptional regulator, TetR family [Lysinibacillus sp. SG9]SDB11446.1 transcriptional regulator, TetR family [Lysinibacillus sp. TC-37]
MREMKKAEERRNEILDAADELFTQKGFDGTSTSNILEKVGIARGTLYYHFKSKEDIMDALIERYTSTMLAKARAIAEDKSIAVNERILRVVMALNIQHENGGQEIMEHVHKPQNALMHRKIQQVVMNQVPPILTAIIRDGIEQGVYHTPYPYECMEMIIAYTNAVFDDDLVLMTDEERAARIPAFIFNVERMLGVENGSLLYMMQMFGKDGEGSTT